MASEIKANKLSPATGTDVTLGDSGDTFTVPSGATITNSGTATGFGLTDWSESGGSLVASNAAYGIYLGVATATAANLLDDYEEGSWTPVPKGGGVDINSSVEASAGKYTKVGALVYIKASIRMNRGTNTGSFTITGIPFAPASTVAANVLLDGRGNDYVTLHSGGLPLTWVVDNSSVIYNYVAPPDQSTALGGGTVQMMIGASAERNFAFSAMYNTA